MRSVEMESRTASGRVHTLGIGTSRGRYRCGETTFASSCRSAGGEILNSTYFSVESRQNREAL